MGMLRHAYNILVGKHERKAPLRRPRILWEECIRMDLSGNSVGGCGLDASDSGEGGCNAHSGPKKAGNF
jgi:hypothetical protein